MIEKELKLLGNDEKAKSLQRFFKTGPGQYGEGDVFLGITVPEQRKLARKYISLDFPGVQHLIKSPIHEYRLTGLLILVEQYKKSHDKQQIVDFYLAHTQYINNWDLVDLTAEPIIGSYLLDKDRSILYKLAQSELVWERRIAIVATFEFIKQQQYQDTFKIAQILLYDQHDLIHKAVGWMLKEIGKRISQEVEEEFLRQYYKQMPRTMLRYAIEKFSDEKKKRYMSR